MDLTVFGANRSGYFLRGYDDKVDPVLSNSDSFQTAPVKCDEARRGSYRASNAFGATTTIYRVTQTVVEIAVVRPLGSTSDAIFLMTSVKMEPDIARQMTPHLRLQYEGRLALWKNGSSVACGVSHLSPDMSTTWDTTTDTCIFRGVIERVAVVDGRTGAVVAERTFRDAARSGQ